MKFNTKDGQTAEWIDLSLPLDEAAQTRLMTLGFPKIDGIWKSDAVPHFEEREGFYAVTLKSYHPKESDTLLILFNRQTLVTLHESELPWLEMVKNRGTTRVLEGEYPLLMLVADILLESVFSFESPLDEIEKDIDQIEDRVFNRDDVPEAIESIFHLKHHLGQFYRIHRYTIDLIGKIMIQFDDQRKVFRHALSEAEASFQFADRMRENLGHLVNVQISLASHRTNEIVRVLTLFSVFFMPLTFIAGVYGMNFPNMPEIHWAYGYPAVLLAMGGISVATFLWFRNKGWLK